MFVMLRPTSSVLVLACLDPLTALALCPPTSEPEHSRLRCIASPVGRYGVILEHD